MFPLMKRRRSAALFRVTPGAVPSGSTFTRSTTATYKDVNGTRQTAAINTVRSRHFISGVQTILLEGASTNHFLNSGTPATQTSASLSTGTYTLWMEGTGSIAVAGTTATITGAGTATNGVPVTFVVTVAGTVTYTVTGSPTLAQAENLAFASSYIPTTGAAVTRGADNLSFPFTIVPQPMTVYTKFVESGSALLAAAQPRIWHIGDGANSVARVGVYNNGDYSVIANPAGSQGVVSAGAGSIPALGTVVELRSTVDATDAYALFQSKAGAAETGGTPTAALGAFPAAWSAATLWLNSLGTTQVGFAAFQSIKIAGGVQSMASMRAL